MIFRKQTTPSFKHPLLVGISGKSLSGKTTAAEYLGREYGCVNIAFADVLKSMIYDLVAIEGDERETFLKYAKSVGADFDFHAFPRPNLNNPGRTDKVAWVNRNKGDFRQLMQIYGDFKRSQDSEFFVDRAAAAIEKAIENGAFAITVDDVRFYNEVHALERVGFSMVRVNASDEIRLQRGADISASTHQSETQLDGLMHSFVVFNNLEKSMLYSQLDDVVIGVLNHE